MASEKVVHATAAAGGVGAGVSAGVGVAVAVLLAVGVAVGVGVAGGVESAGAGTTVPAGAGPRPAFQGLRPRARRRSPLPQPRQHTGHARPPTFPVLETQYIRREAVREHRGLGDDAGGPHRHRAWRQDRCGAGRSRKSGSGIGSISCTHLLCGRVLSAGVVFARALFAHALFARLGGHRQLLAEAALARCRRTLAAASLHCRTPAISAMLSSSQ